MSDYYRVPDQQIDSIWPKIENWVEASLLGDVTINTDDVKALCIKGSLELWIVSKESDICGFLIGRIGHNPRGKYYYSWLFGGVGDEWIRGAYDALKAHAKTNDCKQLNMIGRPAWKKLFDIAPLGVYYSVEL